MKKHMKSLLVMVVAVLMLAATALPVFADDFDFDEVIEDFVPDHFNVIEMEIGDKENASAANWTQVGAKCYSSDESVATVSKNGVIRAVGEGTAYVAVVAPVGSSYQVCKVVVKAKPTGLAALLENLSGYVAAFSFSSIFIAFAFYTVFSTIIKTSRCRRLIAEFEVQPSQANAEKLLKTLKKLNIVHRTMFRLGGQGIIRKEDWAVLYGHYIYPSPYVKDETKLGIRDALIRIGVYNLNKVHVSNYDGQQRGALGEDNAWFTLCSLTDSEKCNVFRNVYVEDETDGNEIDSLIVSPKGIFLLEVKSVTHKPTNSNDVSSTVIFSDIEDPYKQIQIHADRFKNCFGLSQDVIHNLLVMSYPRDERRAIDISTFPTNKNFIPLKVENLMEYIKKYDGPVVLDDETIIAISQKLKTCLYRGDDGKVKTKWKFCSELTPRREPAPAQAAPAAPAAPAKFCPQCGHKLTSQTPFCPNCGNKLN